MSNNEAQGFYASSKITWSDTANQNVLMERLTGPTFVPRPWQIDATATLLDGHDLLLIPGTGQGKSSIIYLPILAHPDKMTFVVTPTILLAHDHVKSVTGKGLRAIAINADTTRAAASEQPPRNLWKEVQGGRYQVVCTSHEQFYRDDACKITQDSRVSKRLGTVIIDEVHLLGDWKSFRPAFKNWQWFRACIPPHVPIAACTATLAMGTPYTAILRALGFREHSVTGPANFKLIKLDTERHNISLHLRQIQHSVSGWKFSDLEWLISERVGDDPSCWPKTIVYCEAIDLGHRVVTALRKILPLALTSRAQDIVRHIHSLRCSSCKAEVKPRCWISRTISSNFAWSYFGSSLECDWEAIDEFTGHKASLDDIHIQLGKAIVVGGHNTELLVINRIRDEHEFVSDELSQSQRRRCGGGSRGIGGLVLGVEPAVPETGPIDKGSRSKADRHSRDGSA